MVLQLKDNIFVALLMMQNKERSQGALKMEQIANECSPLVHPEFIIFSKAEISLIILIASSSANQSCVPNFNPIVFKEIALYHFPIRLLVAHHQPNIVDSTSEGWFCTPLLL